MTNKQNLQDEIKKLNEQAKLLNYKWNTNSYIPLPDNRARITHDEYNRMLTIINNLAQENQKLREINGIYEGAFSDIQEQINGHIAQSQSKTPFAAIFPITKEALINNILDIIKNLTQATNIRED